MVDPPNAKSGEIAPRYNHSGHEPSGPCLRIRTTSGCQPGCAARLERDQILMPQLVDDLPRRLRCARRSCSRRTTSPPVQYARSLSGPVSAERSTVVADDVAPTGCRSTARCRRCRPARRSSWRCRRPRSAVSRLALSRPSVNTTTARRSESRVRHLLGRARDRVVQRRRAERRDRRQLSRQTLRARRERRDLVEPRVEGEDCRLVVRRRPAS